MFMSETYMGQQFFLSQPIYYLCLQALRDLLRELMALEG